MFPIRDDIPSGRLPIVNWVVIGICAVVFLAQWQESQRPGPSLVERFGMIPVRVLHPDRPVMIPDVQVVRTPFGLQQQMDERLAAPAAVPDPWTLLTCVFLHGGWMHFLGNMWFLFIFGDNVEDRLGHLGYLLFYLGCGLAASFAHLATNSTSNMPTIGASGAIAGVMGAYFYLYPRASVLTLIPIVFYVDVISLPAPIFLGIWFVFQLVQGVVASSVAQASTGVAWWAHIGGFAAGVAAMMLFAQTFGMVARPAKEST